ncbi:MAG: aldose epimerase family protein [Pirellulales bacterium]
MRCDTLFSAICTLAMAAAVAAGQDQSRAEDAKTSEASTMDVRQEPFGTLSDGTAVELYTLTNQHKVVVKLTNYGAIITSVRTADLRGNVAEVSLGFDTLDEYLSGHPYFGAICGRFANRIARGRFTIDGVEYRLAVNNGENHLHGGLKGFDKVVWKAEPFREKNAVGVKLTYTSPDGEEGYPGNLACTVIYTLTGENELKMEYLARTDKTTPINLANHTYWNFADAGAGDVHGHLLTIQADKYLPVDEGGIPTGELKNVRGTPMDFTRPTAIGARIDQVPGDPGGYDHCYVLNKPAGSQEGTPTLAARVVEPVSGRVMEVFTTQPGVQLYTGNYLDGSLESRGARFEKQHAFCLETQHFPDAVHQPSFPSTLLEPGQTYRHLTVHKFSTR